MADNSITPKKSQPQADTTDFTELLLELQETRRLMRGLFILTRAGIENAKATAEYTSNVQVAKRLAAALEEAGQP